MMSVDDFKTAHTWIRDEYLPTYAAKGTWQEKLSMISTWNEYGEGTYIMPSKGNGGFGYLDALREVYTDEKVDKSLDLYPTDAQRTRITASIRSTDIFFARPVTTISQWIPLTLKASIPSRIPKTRLWASAIPRPTNLRRRA